MYSAINAANCLKLDIGWMTLHFGRDGNWNEFVVATANCDSFYMGVEPIPVVADAGWETGIPWVYAMKHHPEELFVGAKPPTVLQYAGFTVTHAMDQRRRNFVTVAMPGGKLHLVFRNPCSRATADWRPSKSPIAITAPVVQLPVVAKPAVLVVAQAKAPTVIETTGDVDMDELLGLLGVMA